MNSLNGLRLQRGIRTEQINFLNSLVKQVENNLRDLDISGIFNILNFSHEIEDGLYAPIYEAIQDNLFSSITEEGECMIDTKVLFDCFEKISTKRHKIKRPTAEDFGLLLGLVENTLKKGIDQHISLITKQLAFMIQEEYFPLRTIDNLAKILI